MNCRDFIIEFEDRANLSEPAQLHLTICADCRKTSEKQTRIWLLIEQLNAVAAPSDFDFHVKARIARAAPTDFQPSRLLPILRYVLPVIVAVLLFGLFALYSGYFSVIQNPPPIARTVETPLLPETLPVKSSTSDELAAVSPNSNQLPVEPLPAANPTAGTLPKIVRRAENKRTVKVETADSSANRRTESRRKPAETASEITSRDIASTGTVVRTANGINLNAPTATNIEGSKPADDASVLKFFGIETLMENGRRTVVKIDKNSAAEYSGVKIGDVIEKVKDNAVMIVRGTEKLEIVLQNKTDQKP